MSPEANAEQAVGRRPAQGNNCFDTLVWLVPGTTSCLVKPWKHLYHIFSLGKSQEVYRICGYKIFKKNNKLPGRGGRPSQLVADSLQQVAGRVKRIGFSTH